MRDDRKRMDIVGIGRGPLETALIDDLLAGRIDRRGLLRRGSALGLGLPLLGGMSLAAAGCSGQPARPAPAAAGTIRAGVATPVGAVDPVTVHDSGSYQLFFQTAEFLCVTRPDLTLRPVLAESWSPDADGRVWTFKLRRGVTFHNGQAMTADDVVATFDRLSDPRGSSNALSVFKGLLSKGGTRKVDDHTVAFHLDAPNGNFPYAVSIDNYNAVILPAGYRGGYEADFIGTGPFRFESYTPQVGATFVRNPDYWGPKALPDRIEFKFYAEPQPRLIALQAGEVDVLDAVPIVLATTLQNDPDIEILRIPSASHRQLHMKCDTGPFADKRVRQALALCLDRRKLVDGLCHGMATIGNDSPFSAFYPQTDPSVPQRTQQIAQARQLMQAAGHAQGFDATLTAIQYSDIAQYAQLVQEAAKAIGIRFDLKVESQTQYYGKSLPGQSDWLDSVVGITDYAHRGTPDAALGNPYRRDGPWNAAHFRNPSYDALLGRYEQAVDPAAQRAAAGQIQRLLLDETPVIISYFPDLLVPVRKGVSGLPPLAAGLLLDRVSRS